MSMRGPDHPRPDTQANVVSREQAQTVVPEEQVLEPRRSPIITPAFADNKEDARQVLETDREWNGPRRADGRPDLRYKANEVEGTAVFDQRHRNPHQGRPNPLRRRRNRPMAKLGQVANQDGTLDLRFLENRIIAGLVDPKSMGLTDEEVARIMNGEALEQGSDYDLRVREMHARRQRQDAGEVPREPIERQQHRVEDEAHQSGRPFVQGGEGPPSGYRGAGRALSLSLC